MKHLTLTLLTAACLASLPALAGDARHWSYDGEAGPGHWGTLAPEFALCGTGKNQSPIDIRHLVDARLAALDFNYTTQATEILNNGHTVQANFAPGSTLGLNGQVFELKQIHFHAPSENHIRGRSFPLEGHLVHADKEGNLAVVAVMFEAGAAHPALEKLWQQMPEKAGDKTSLAAKLTAAEFLPGKRDYYRFNGSLTTPPCSEGVAWLVMKHPVSVKAEQVEHFAHTLHHPNNRPLQAVNARPVLD